MSRKMIVLVSLICMAGFSTMGCGGSAPPAPTASPDSPCPAWFSSPPEDPNFFYAASTATSRDLQMAMDKARLAGRGQLSAQLSTHIQGLTTNFNEEIGLAEEAHILAKYTSATKQVIDQTLRGSKAKETSQRKEGNVWRACVLMEVPVGSAESDLVAQISKDEEMYTRFRESQTFKQLEYEIDKKREYDASK